MRCCPNHSFHFRYTPFAVFGCLIRYTPSIRPACKIQKAGNVKSLSNPPATPRNFLSGNFGAFVGVVLRAANQNPMIAEGDHTIIQRILSARWFPHGGNHVGASRRQCTIKHYAAVIRWYHVETGYLSILEPRYGQYGSAQKFATLAGGYYPPLFGACHVGGRVPQNFLEICAKG